MTDVKVVRGLNGRLSDMVPVKSCNWRKRIGIRLGSDRLMNVQSFEKDSTIYSIESRKNEAMQWGKQNLNHRQQLSVVVSDI